TARTFFSKNAGLTWSPGTRLPTGDFSTCVAISPNYASSREMYAATAGEESAFSISLDEGNTWNQTGLIDTRIMSILDLGVSPDYDQDATLFLVTASIRSSVWRSSDGGEGWERIFCSSPAGEDRIDRILLSPQYHQNQKVFLARTGYPFIWHSADSGRQFKLAVPVDPQNGEPVNLYAWAITTGDTLGIGSYNGTNGLVYLTAPGSLEYIRRAGAGQDPVHSLAFSPDYADDGTILAGNKLGSIFYSTDSGRVFEPLHSPDSLEPPLTGRVSVAFDSDYGWSRTVYAAGDSSNGGIHRFVIDESVDWEPVDNSLPAGAAIGQIATAVSGTLYAINSQPVDNDLNKGGIERSLNPAAAVPLFETVTAGLGSKIQLKGLWLQENHLWTVDNTNSKLLIYTDTLVFPPAPLNPPDGAGGLNYRDVSISWQPLEGAAEYHWQVDTDDQFGNIPANLEGYSDSPSVRLPTLSINTNYYWRVRAASPIAGPWSVIRTFDTSVVEVMEVPDLDEPSFDSTTSVAPIFRWSACEGAGEYELQLSTAVDFSSGLVNIFTGTNFWECVITLDHGARYYWRVRAISGENRSDWSEIYLFNVEAPSGDSLPAPKIVKPKSASTAVKPAFEWSLIEGAEIYVLQISRYDDFSSLVVDRSGDDACNANSWQCTIDLQYSTSYYWRVRAVTEEIRSDWSPVAVFTTREEPSSTSSGQSSSGGSRSSPSTTPSPSPTPSPEPTQSVVPSPTPSPPTASGASSGQEAVTLSDPTGLVAGIPDTATPTPISAVVTTAPLHTSRSAEAAGGEENRFWQYLTLGLIALTVLLCAVVFHLAKKSRPEKQ
ncbi:MAG: hypothetical protein PHU23_14845, partial [Dehalococcoidales bacterium]|nr:hypothetical protein [Dehalococcoidales bacterium]